MVTLSQVKAVNSKWFSKENKKLFGDINYMVRQGKTSKQPYLIRFTSAWSDMFDGVKKYHYRINKIDPNTLQINSLIDTIFKSKESVREWLKEN